MVKQLAWCENDRVALHYNQNHFTFTEIDASERNRQWNTQNRRNCYSNDSRELNQVYHFTEIRLNFKSKSAGIIFRWICRSDQQLCVGLALQSRATVLRFVSIETEKKCCPGHKVIRCLLARLPFRSNAKKKHFSVRTTLHIVSMTICNVTTTMKHRLVVVAQYSIWADFFFERISLALPTNRRHCSWCDRNAFDFLCYCCVFQRRQLPIGCYLVMLISLSRLQPYRNNGQQTFEMET